MLCGKCHVIKKLSEFRRSRAWARGRFPLCKECERQGAHEEFLERPRVESIW